MDEMKVSHVSSDSLIPEMIQETLLILVTLVYVLFLYGAQGKSPQW